MNIMLYVEGGGSKGKVRRDCRKAFQSFIRNAGVKRAVRVVACGSRGDAFKSFEVEHSTGSATAVLLVDAEGPVTARGPWQHLKGSDNWDRPANATDSQCQLMLQVMESWFLADVDTLETFFRTGFRRQALPRNPNVEDVPKQYVLDGLERATRGGYDKGKHSFNILAMLDPGKVMKASPHADRFINSL